MKPMYVKSFADLMNGNLYAEIRCAIHGTVVRRLSASGHTVTIDALEPPTLSVPASTPITYEAWMMDRGSMLFTHAEMPGQKLKICTEADIIRYNDGSEYAIAPPIMRVKA